MKNLLVSHLINIGATILIHNVRQQQQNYISFYNIFSSTKKKIFRFNC
jgi:hypothetical protein